MATRGEKDVMYPDWMTAAWTTTAAGLPSDGSTVEFVLDERECPLRGIYALGRFESRWTCYPPTSVRQWRTTSSIAELARSGPSHTLSFASLHA
jgi:hypothetical protein